MLVEGQVTIHGSRGALWALITDLENAAKFIRGIQDIQVVEKPPQGLVGLRWRETRELFGKPATVEKWITEAVENTSYATRAEEGGMVFLTTLRISEGEGALTLTSSHETRPRGLGARIKAAPLFLFKGVIRKAILQDLQDLKAALEGP
ncbi:MAG: SRPBCC family protein [Acidobacteria bacterium]|nr:SRPBCC family protein [Acidobacteriota bacterium]